MIIRLKQTLFLNPKETHKIKQKSREIYKGFNIGFNQRQAFRKSYALDSYF